MMPEQAAMVEVRRMLHDLCQPLTALECGLFLAKMEEDPAALRTGIDDALVQCHRMLGTVRALQQTMDGLGSENGGRHGVISTDGQGAAGRDDDADSVAG